MEIVKERVIYDVIYHDRLDSKKSIDFCMYANS